MIMTERKNKNYSFYYQENGVIKVFQVMAKSLPGANKKLIKAVGNTRILRIDTWDYSKI
jgi:hypothetical protein